MGSCLGTTGSVDVAAALHLLIHVGNQDQQLRKRRAISWLLREACHHREEVREGRRRRQVREHWVRFETLVKTFVVQEVHVVVLDLWGPACTCCHAHICWECGMPRMR